MEADSIITAWPARNVMLQRNFGTIDGREMIKMNNLAVGYFPTDYPETGVYPPLKAAEEPGPDSCEELENQIIEQVPAARCPRD